MLCKLPILSLFPQIYLINSMKHEHSCKIFYFLCMCKHKSTIENFIKDSDGPWVSQFYLYVGTFRRLGFIQMAKSTFIAAITKTGWLGSGILYSDAFYRTDTHNKEWFVHYTFWDQVAITNNYELHFLEIVIIAHNAVADEISMLQRIWAFSCC